MAIDAAAATAAYLAQLPPEVHARAQAYTQGGHWLLLWTALVAVAAAWLILKSGLLTRVIARLERKKGRPVLASFAAVFVFFLADWVLELPWALYSQWWREKAYGLNNQTWIAWLVENAIGAVIGTLLAALFLTALYALMRRSPRRWWLWSGGLVAVFFGFVILVSPVLIAPIFNHYTPAPAGPSRDAVADLARRSGVPDDKIFVYDGSKQSDRYTANVSGLFGTARIAMSDAMVKKGADILEVRAVVGHEIGHYVRGHALWYALSYGALAILGFFLIDRLFPLAARLAGAKGVMIADPAGLPVLVMLLTVMTLVATPIYSSISRIGENDADVYSLEHAREPDGLAKALLKTVEYRAATPSKLEEVIFYNHPSVGARIRRAMDWKMRQEAEGARG